jgi:hypothetical protein
MTYLTLLYLWKNLGIRSVLLSLMSQTQNVISRSYISMNTELSRYTELVSKFIQICKENIENSYIENLRMIFEAKHDI